LDLLDSFYSSSKTLDEIRTDITPSKYRRPMHPQWYPHLRFGDGAAYTMRFFPDKLPIGVPLKGHLSVSWRRMCSGNAPPADDYSGPDQERALAPDWSTFRSCWRT
jgi:hypothetical protein